MARKKVNDNPNISEGVVFDLITPNQQKESQNPSSIDKIVIFYLEVSHQAEKKQTYQKNYTDSISHSIYVNEAMPVYILGSEKEKVWTPEVSGYLKNTAPGHFELIWESPERREGNYIITWSYRHKEVLQNQNMHFSLASEPVDKVLAPYHETEPDKYKTLLDRYLPPAFKTEIMDGDLTPEVINKLHTAVGSGFTLLDNLAIQLVDVIDPNYTQQALLPLLAAFFDIRLRSTDTGNWRRQIKQAVPLFKAKGTLRALKEALDQAGIKLKKLTKLWQVASPYTRVESFRVKDDNHVFELKKQPIGKIQISVRSAETKDYLELPTDLVTINKSKVAWAGSVRDEAVVLLPGDIVRIQYQHREIPNAEQEELNKYIMSLPLADQRDETAQCYPLKNWNIRVIEEDNPLISRVIIDKHPFHELVVFGKVRSTFMYSEKVYNMDTYDGSLRESTSFCDIDKDFLDYCVNCQGSKFSVDLEITKLSNERIQEAYEIIEEFSPLHAVLHTMNIRGSLYDFVLPPADKIKSKVEHKKDSGLTDKIVIKDRLKFRIQKKDGSKEEGEI